MNPLIKTLQAAKSKHLTSVETQQKIQGVLSNQPLPEVDSSRLEQTKSAYEAAAADIAIGLLSDADLATVKSAFESAKAEHQKAADGRQHAQATINGLQSRLAITTAAVEAAHADLVLAEGAYLTKEIELADAEYLRLAKGVQEQYLRIAACTALLKQRQLQAANIPMDPVKLTGIGPVSCAFIRKNRPFEPTGIGEPLFVGADANEVTKRNEISVQMESDSYASGIFSKAMTMIKS